MSSVKISGNASGTGTFTISSPNSNTDRTITLPDNTGTILTTGSQIEFGAGTVSAPSISTSGDTNTGIFFPAADTIAFSEGGTEAMRIDSSGRVGIGTTSPSNKLAVSNGGANGFEVAPGASETTVLSYNRSTNVYTDVLLYGGNLRFFTAPAGSATEYMRIDSSGNVGIGTSSPAYKLDVVSTSMRIASGTTGVGYVQYGNSSTATNNWHVGTEGDGTIRFYNGNFGSGTERARITSDGNFLIGTTSTNETSGTGARLGADGYVRSTRSATANTSSTLDVYSTGASAFRFYVGMAGTVFATTTTISAISDQRLKENIQDIDVGLDAVMALKPRKFDWKEGKGKNIKGDRGWIAQEFEQVFPDMISTWKDEAPEGEEPYKAVGADLIPILTKAIQELKAITDAQTTRIEALEAEVAAMKAGNGN